MSTRGMTAFVMSLCLAVGAAMWFFDRSAPDRPVGEDKSVMGRDSASRSPLVRSRTTPPWRPPLVTIAACRMPQVPSTAADATMPAIDDLTKHRRWRDLCLQREMLLFPALPHGPGTTPGSERGVGPGR